MEKSIEQLCEEYFKELNSCSSFLDFEYFIESGYFELKTLYERYK